MVHMPNRNVLNVNKNNTKISLQLNNRFLLLLFSHSVMSDSLRPMGLTVAHQAPLSMAFPRQEHWSELPFPPPGDLPKRGIKPTSPALAEGFFTTEPPGKPPNLFTVK